MVVLYAAAIAAVVRMLTEERFKRPKKWARDLGFAE